MSAINRLRQAQQAKNATTSLGATQIAWLLVSSLGLIPLAVLVLICFVGIVMLLGGPSGSAQPSPSAGANASKFPDGSGDVGSYLLGGAGNGTFATDQVPRPELVQTLKDAGKECDLITPVVLAAQIQVESAFDPALVGPNGEEGISQLPPDVFKEYGKDEDGNGKVSALDAEDSIFAQARYLCDLGKDVKRLLDSGKVHGDLLTLTLSAWDSGLHAVEDVGGMPILDPDSYAARVRSQFQEFTSGIPTSEPPSASPSTSASGGTPDAAGVSEAQFNQMFPGRNSLYTYAGLTAAMKKYPAFGGTGDETARKREIAAFLANVDHESGGLKYAEEIDTTVWGTYCDTGKPYGCPAGQTAYHGRGPLQLSWNYNYKAAGDALGVDLLDDPDKVKNDATVAWQTALWYWMTQSGPGAGTAHAGITGGGGFGATIRSINGTVECNGARPDLVQSRVDAYQKFTKVLGVEPGGNLSC
ncbi:glycoside hydrolase family 19 protein [Actinoplanes sp. NPDC049548]|uniref:glycoside hydrolase family 19 protein n=1 Tax=Actinoplanes sp. NPDC049548 TaxID=3155152 RepID=UPI00341341AF